MPWLFRKILSKKTVKYRIGVDLGGTKTEIILTENNPLKILKRKRISTNADNGYEHIVQQTADLIHDFATYCEVTPLVGIGIPGSINPKTGLVRNANTICLIGHPLQADLESALKLPVRIENDANCFTLSEALLGAGKGYDTVMGLIMGTGMGGGLVISGEIKSGLQGITGEFGHMSIKFDGPECWCGERGCLELYISGTAAENNYTRLSGKRKKLKDIYANFAENSDNFASQTMDDLLFYFGIGIGNLITAFDPDIVVVGGGVSNIPLLYTEGKNQVQKRIFNDEMDTPIVRNKLGDSSGVFGAALLAGT
ncbi:ROK family protein [bacterium]|nr:ROK family protein [bacterium]